jgi:hypothetical protein
MRHLVPLLYYQPDWSPQRCCRAWLWSMGRSRADHIEVIGLPIEAARREIILDTLKSVGTVWKGVRSLEADASRLAKAAEGLDGRRIRKEIFVAMASDVETAKDPGRLTTTQIEAAFRQALKTHKELEK